VFRISLFTSLQSLATVRGEKGASQAARIVKKKILEATGWIAKRK